MNGSKSFRAVTISLVLVLACKKASPPEQTKPVDPDPPPSEAGVQPTPIDATPAQPSCDTLSRRLCLQSDHCTLELAGNNMYRCRPDQGPCEVGVKQTDKAACEAKTECAFDGGSCYCSCEGASRTITVEETQGGCACACGGGPPATCQEKATLPKK
jgi:hypothetical protein